VIFFAFVLFGTEPGLTNFASLCSLLHFAVESTYFRQKVHPRSFIGLEITRLCHLINGIVGTIEMISSFL
jgi:hypothetical protein